MRRLVIALASLTVGLSVAGAAFAQAEGTYFIYNNSAEQVTLSANTFSGSANFPQDINVGQPAIGTVYQTNGSNVHSGSFVYERQATGNGCVFTTTMIRSRSTGIWSFRFTATPYGTGSTTVCTFVPTSTNAATGKYYADATMSGF